MTEKEIKDAAKAAYTEGDKVKLRKLRAEYKRRFMQPRKTKI